MGTLPWDASRRGHLVIYASNTVTLSSSPTYAQKPVWRLELSLRKSMFADSVGQYFSTLLGKRVIHHVAVDLDQNYHFVASQLLKLTSLQASLKNLDPRAEDCLRDAVAIFAAADMEQQDLAKRLDVGPPTVSKWLTKAVQPKSQHFRNGVLIEMRQIMEGLVDAQEKKLSKIRPPRRVSKTKKALEP